MKQFNRKWTLDREKFLSESEVKKLRRTIEDKALADLQKGRTTWPRFWMAIDLGASAGLRVSEIANLKIDNLYLNTREPRIRVTGKGNRTRDVFISRDLMKHLSGFLEWKRTMDEPMDKNDFLLVSSHGKSYSTRALQYAFKVAMVESGLPIYYSIHSLRHSYGTYLYQRTKDLRLVQKQLGHSSIATTTIYADVTVEQTLEAVNGLFEENYDQDSETGETETVPPSDHPTKPDPE
ncbi:tyrosine-type recombinase/integrase [uncultured Desulfosarcina sp.]|uniref:tyrosine-type recombinase/integrase n=1 Tax=uncultured Desulfosarcina sp. TaxID=218289 RepID=UPI0029C8DDD5|nr:tyrosine-type recombinase/integrase [uncultured Desulfosarcina sp.]